jgi:RNA polymerase sigma-70 factor (ECF subfamily)
MQDEWAELRAIAAGDAEAFGRWVAGVESSLRLSLRPFAALVDTEAVLQEALLRVWQVAPRFKPDGKKNALVRFAMTTTRNVALSELRRVLPTATELDTLERELERHQTIAPITPDPHLRAAIAACRQKLPGKPSEAMAARLNSGGGEDDAALAARLGMSLNTFLQNFTRARKFLAECLKKAGVDLDMELS